MKYLVKEQKIFPPFLIQGSGLFASIRRQYLIHSEFLSAMIVVAIFVNFIAFCGKQDQGNPIFRLINTIISFIISLDVILKLSLIRTLYLNPQYYGLGFAILDILSGPLSFLLNIYYINSEVTINFADILLLLRIFCLERIRLLIRDVFYILYVSRYINYALLLTFYVYSYIAYTLFQVVSPNFFRNVFKSMLSMFQVLTLDSWNQQVNQPVSKVYGQICGVFFLFFILFMFFYFINLLLGAFVSYYSNPHLRRNFEYDFAHDEQLNPEIAIEYRQSIDIKSALKVLGLEQNAYETARDNWGMGDYEWVIYLYISLQVIYQIIQIFYDIKIGAFIIEQIFGIIIIWQFIIKLKQYISFRRLQHNQMDDEASYQLEEASVRLYVLILLALSGPIATIVDLITYPVFNILRWGPMLRVLSVLAILYVQKLIYKFYEVLPGVSHIIIFIGGILFSMALIGHQCLSSTDDLFKSLTSTYLFMLQVVTFDSWGDIARKVIQQNGVLFVIYFLFLTIFVGFFLMNMLVGVMATMTQPKTQELFEKDNIMRQRINERSVQQLNEQIQQNKNESINELKQLLDDFNNSRTNDKMYIIIDGIQYEITTKNFIQLNDEQ
ncbi:hypothetical protein pb186bvf_013748 [Paramecium bursaria]